MNKECDLIRDLLPLYTENLVSDYTRNVVDEHLNDCPECRNKLDSYKNVPAFSSNMEMAPLKSLKKMLLIKKIQTIAFTVAFICILITAAFAYLTIPQYIPYSKDLLTITEASDGTLTINFSETVSDYHYEKTKLEGDCTHYFIEAWYTKLDILLDRKSPQRLTITPEDGEIYNIFYNQNVSDSVPDKEEVLIYSTSLYNNYGVYTLPRLALSYYFMLALILCVIFAIVWLIFFKKKQIRIWIERLLLLPFSYMLGHICIKGFSSSSYAMQRDFSFIILTAFFIYLTLLCGINLYRKRKALKQNHS